MGRKESNQTNKLTTGMHNIILLSISQASCGQLVLMLKTLGPHGIFGSNFAYLFILTLSSIILNGRGI